MKPSDRLLDLLAARATEGLSPEDSLALEALLAAQDEIDAEDFNLAAAHADVALQALLGDEEPLPEMLRARIFVASVEHLPAPGKAKSGLLDWRNLGWLAAAAMLVLALWAPWSRESAPPSLAAERDALITEASDLIQVAWAPSAVEGYTGVEGDVVWSPSRQTGYMRFRGLPENRPTAEQYQLWIVDPSRDTHPIDGGVFNVPADRGEVIVPIDAKLAVVDARAFAVTLEKPGGVVVSDGPLLIVAPIT